MFYRELTNNDVDDVTDLLIEAYYPYDGLVACVPMTKEELYTYANTNAKIMIPMGLSIGAYDAENKLCGVSLSLYSTWEYDELPVSDKYDILSRFEEWCELCLNEEFGTDNFLIDDIVAVAPHCNDRGIGTELLKRKEQMAIDRGFDFIVGFAVSEKNMRILAKLGYECLKKLDLLSYKDPVTR
uniref:N-acetyltransferase domain-containing protein n=1 Tax=Ciona savignyi TaxID=51511 RepID=H2YRZ6_CIOSA